MANIRRLAEPGMTPTLARKVALADAIGIQAERMAP